MNQMLDRRLAALVLDGRPFTADDLTNEGAAALDANHAPNGKQNGIGAYVNQAAQRGLIEWTGQVVKSKAPKRKGGAIRVWMATTAGLRWARNVR